MRARGWKGYLAIAAAAVALLAARPAVPSAHEIPADVLVQIFVKPEGSRLTLLVRVPLAAARDIDFPTDGAGYLDLTRSDPQVRNAAWLWVANGIELFEDAKRLRAPRLVAARVSLPSDRSFASYDAAYAHVTGAGLPPETLLIWNQALLDVLFEFPITSDRARFSIDPALARLGTRVATVLRFLPPAGVERALAYGGDPGLVRLDPSWRQTASRFVSLGSLHILGGVDHLLFLLCLVLPVRRLAPLALIVTSFTVAHSITLIASALDAVPGALWFPPLIETLIAASIVYMALENIVIGAEPAAPAAAGDRSTIGSSLSASQMFEFVRRTAVRRAKRDCEGTPRNAEVDTNVRPEIQGRVPSRLDRRWMIVFAFGLVHGFGFSFALRDTLQFAGSHLVVSLLSFNLGVEIGQLLVLIVLIPAIAVMFRTAVPERIGTIIISGLVAHQAWHWLTERADTVRRFGWPSLSPTVVVWTLRGAFVLFVIAGAAWFFKRSHVDAGSRRHRPA